MLTSVSLSKNFFCASLNRLTLSLCRYRFALALVLSPGCKVENTHKMTMQARMQNAITLPASDVSTRVTLARKFLRLAFRCCMGPMLPPLGNDNLLLQGCSQKVVNVFNCLSSDNNKVTVIMKDAIETITKPTVATRKNSKITSTEDLIEIPKRIVPQNSVNTWTTSTLATQLLTRCSCDGTFFWRSHSPKKRLTSDFAFPISRKGTNKIVG